MESIYDSDNLDTQINIRIDRRTLEEFKKACGGRKYQSKVRQLMRKYIQEIEIEESKRVRKDTSINTDFLTN